MNTSNNGSLTLTEYLSFVNYTLGGGTDWRIFAPYVMHFYRYVHFGNWMYYSVDVRIGLTRTVMGLYSSMSIIELKISRLQAGLKT